LRHGSRRARRSALALFGLAALLVAPPSSAVVTIDWVQVGDPNNPPDTATNCAGANCGSVDHTYRIAKYDTTNAQYAEFLNAVDPGGSNPLELYRTGMSTDANGGINFVSGNAPGAKYVVKSGFADKPVIEVTFIDAVRFANWLNNGQGSGSTETGAYTLFGGTPIPSNPDTAPRNPGATTFLPSENEWYKAAYFNGTSYFAYPAGTSTPTVCATPGATPNTANCFPGGPDELTNVGAYTGSASPYGTFDQGGNVYQWNEQQSGPNGTGHSREVRGGRWFQSFPLLAASNVAFSSPVVQNNGIGFRVASLPEADDDGDGVPNSADNCRFVANANQTDTGGIGGGSPPDGVGDACECGDVNGDGAVTLVDAVIVQRSLLQPPTATLAHPELCDVGGSAGCSLADAVIIRRALLVPPTATIQQVCPPAKP
jgi:formylglycine-generating enzyme required for sulfatase activity